MFTLVPPMVRCLAITIVLLAHVHNGKAATQVEATGPKAYTESWLAADGERELNPRMVCEFDKNGRFVSVDIYNISFKKMIITLAALADERVRIDECPDVHVTLGFQNRSFFDAMYRLLTPRGFEINRDGTGGYIIQKRKEKLQGPTQREE